MFYFLRIVCFAYKGFHFPVNFDCSEGGRRPSACLCRRVGMVGGGGFVNCFGARNIREKGREIWWGGVHGMHVTPENEAPPEGKSSAKSRWLNEKRAPEITRSLFSAAELLGFGTSGVLGHRRLSHARTSKSSVKTRIRIW